MEIDYHVVKDKLQAGVIHLLPISISNEVVDIFTKPFAASPFSSFHSKLGMLDFHTPTYRGVLLNTKEIKSIVDGDNVDPT